MEQSKKNPISAKQARVLKLVLDAVMLVLLVLMYKKQVISMEFHEIGGLALIGLFIVHHLVNMRWIGAVTKTLFAKSTSGMVRARYFVDVLLLIAFLAVGVTGILINKTLFSIHVAGNGKALHYFASALAVILMGVHLGLHADYIFGKMFQKGANRIAKIAIAVLLSCMVAFGGYSLFTTQFVSYLSAPLKVAALGHGDFEAIGEAALDGAQGERPSDLSELPEFTEGTAQQPPQDGKSADGQSGEGSGQFARHGGAEGAREGHGEGGSVNAALLIAQYVSIITLFGAATYGVVRLTGKRKRTNHTETVVVEANV